MEETDQHFLSLNKKLSTRINDSSKNFAINELVFEKVDPNIKKHLVNFLLFHAISGFASILATMCIFEDGESLAYKSECFERKYLNGQSLREWQKENFTKQTKLANVRKALEKINPQRKKWISEHLYDRVEMKVNGNKGILADLIIDFLKNNLLTLLGVCFVRDLKERYLTKSGKEKCRIIGIIGLLVAEVDNQLKVSKITTMIQISEDLTGYGIGGKIEEKYILELLKPEIERNIFTSNAYVEMKILETNNRSQVFQKSKSWFSHILKLLKVSIKEVDGEKIRVQAISIKTLALSLRVMLFFRRFKKIICCCRK